MSEISAWCLEGGTKSREGFLIGQTGHLYNLIRKEPDERVED